MNNKLSVRPWLKATAYALFTETNRRHGTGLHCTVLSQLLNACACVAADISFQEMAAVVAFKQKLQDQISEMVNRACSHSMRLPYFGVLDLIVDRRQKCKSD